MGRTTVFARTDPMPALPRFALSAVALCAALATSPLHAQSVMKPGGWQMDSSMSAVGPDSETKDLGHQSMKMCLSAEKLAQEPYLNPSVDDAKAAARGAKCSTSDYQRSGHSASWRMNCELADGATTAARIRNQASAETLDTEMVQDVTRGGEKAQITMRMKGRYIGDCTPDMTRL